MPPSASGRARTAGPRVRRRGRTLVEMLVVLTLLGGMAAIVAPALRAVTDDGEGADRAARALADRLRRARADAAGRSVAVTLVLDPVSGRTWQATGDDAPMVALAPLPLRAPDGRTTVTIAAGEPRARWTFLPSGVAYGAPVVVRDAAVALVVDVDPSTGAPRVGPR